jgi:hypothetical protein
MFLQSREGTYLDYHYTDPNGLLVPRRIFGRNMRECCRRSWLSLVGCFERLERPKLQVLEYCCRLRRGRWYETRIVERRRHGHERGP